MMKYKGFQKYVRETFSSDLWYFADTCVILYNLSILQEDAPQLGCQICEKISEEHSKFVRQYRLLDLQTVI